MRGYFSQDETEDAGILTDSEDDNEVLRKIDRKGCLLFIRYQYESQQKINQRKQKRRLAFFVHKQDDKQDNQALVSVTEKFLKSRRTSE